MKKVILFFAVAVSLTACTSVETRDVKQDSVKAVDTAKACVDTTKSCVEDIDTTTSKKK